jgi:DNA-binding HxlR family transcriptional regulator
MSQRPRLNRFVAGQRIYARSEIVFAMVLKPRLHQDSPETVVKLRLDPRATVFDVARVIEEAVSANQGEAASNETDRTARFFTAVPGLVLRGLMWLLRTLDFHGLLPRAIHRASPFHVTAFVTDLGSLGIKPIYHHLYDFGTVSFFLAFGAKERERVLAADGRLELKKFISIKVVNDERICDGHYYASAFKYLRGLLGQPERLEAPPERVVEDQD